MDVVIEFLDIIVWHNTLGQYILSLFIFVVLWVAFSLFNKYIPTYLQQIPGKKGQFAQLLISLVKGFPRYFFWAVSVFFPLKALSLPMWIDTTLNVVFTIVLSLELIRIAYRILSFFAQWAMEDANGKVTDKTKLHAIQMIIKVFVWVIGGLLVLLNLGIEISPLLASLWIGWIAVAFALQSILSDVFSSFSIFFDKPFQIGDFVVIGEDKGTVIDISFKSTRIQTLEGPELVIPNKDVMSARINNYAYVPKRRVKVSLGVVYETSAEKLKNIPNILENIIAQYDNLVFGWAVFKEYGPSSLDFELVYSTLADTYKESLLQREEVNYAIFDTFAREGINFAYPTQTIYTKS